MEMTKKELEMAYDSQSEWVEKEWIRIAQFLHGDVQQIFGSVQRDFLKRLPISDQALFLTRIELGQKLLDDLVYELYPPVLETLGLVSALEQYVSKLSKIQNLSIQFHSVEIPKLSEQIQLVLFRIVQRGLSLILVPSNKTTIELTLSLDQKKKLSIKLSRPWTGAAPFQKSKKMLYLSHYAKRINATLHTYLDAERVVALICQLQL